MDPNESQDNARKGQYGVLKLQISPDATSEYTTGQYSSLSFANPAYEPQASGPCYKVEDILTPESRRPSTAKWEGMQNGLKRRWEVAKLIWPYMLTIGFAYFVTLSLYPGIESEIVSCHFGSWMPVIVMAVFNAADLVGKMLAALSYDWSRTNMLLVAGCRMFLVPLILLCAMPRGRPFISGEGYPIFFSMILGLTNGLIGSVPMIQAPSKVPEEHKELSGNIMTLSYNMGLTTGSIVAYLLDSILGPPLKDPCFKFSPLLLKQQFVNDVMQTSLTAVSTTPSYRSSTAATTLAATEIVNVTTVLLDKLNKAIITAIAPTATLLVNNLTTIVNNVTSTAI